MLFIFVFSPCYWLLFVVGAGKLRGLMMLTFAVCAFRHFPQVFRAQSKATLIKGGTVAAATPQRFG
jgi:hypothetical protein